MKIVNRGYLIVQPKQPFVDWANQQETNFNISIQIEPTVYLVEEDSFDDELLIKSHFKKIFACELDAVSDDEDAFPEIKLEIFQAWFDVQFGGTVLDLLDVGLDRD